MSDNYDVVRQTIDDVLSRIYKEMNDYFDYVLNLPSTINRVCRYYAIGLPSDPTVNERYIMFGGTVVRTYEIVLSELDITLQKMRRECNG